MILAILDTIRIFSKASLQYEHFLHQKIDVKQNFFSVLTFLALNFSRPSRSFRPLLIN